MFFPLKDENPTKTRPILTVALIVINLAIFLALFFSGSLDDAVDEYGMRPAEVLEGENLHTLFTSMFLHGSFLHIIGNVWFLWIFGDNIEDICGRRRFLLLFFVGGLIASLAHALFNPSSTVPTIGASGAIAGVLGAYLVLYPRAKVYTILFPIPFIVMVPALLFLGIWFVIQIMGVSITLVVEDVAVAYWAHIGGFVAGVALINFLKKRRI
ncbi:MAG: rhomboid family intramembrane serine protease [Candidatus Hadarchaeota archaeon]|nr:rhomboid family intramembrane serine protease [Candidatus Hadarchaeota archaeon]